MMVQATGAPIAEYFAALDDPRIDRTKRHKLLDIVTIALCATICGADSWVDIELFGNCKEEWFKSFLELPNETVKHSAREYVHGMAHTNGIESHWAMLKRGYVGIYHQMSAKHLPRYVAEFEGRHNSRPLDTDEQMRIMARGADGKWLRYVDLIA